MDPSGLDLDFVQIDITEDEAIKSPVNRTHQDREPNGNRAVELLPRPEGAVYLKFSGLSASSTAKVPLAHEDVERDEARTLQEVASALKDYGVSPMDIAVGRSHDARPSGEVFVQFHDEQFAKSALEADYQQRCIGRPVLSDESEARRSSFPNGRRWRQFEVSLDKDANASMGLDIDKGGDTMLVVKVKTGPVESFNRSRSDEEVAYQVRRGDRIMKMNGTVGSIQTLLETLPGCRRVHMNLQRLVEFQIRLKKKDQSEKLGIDVDHGSNEHLVVTRLNYLIATNRVPEARGEAFEVVAQPSEDQGPIRRYNDEATAECELRVGDVIVEVNGFSGAGGQVKEMLAKISKDLVLVFLVRRAGEEPSSPLGVVV